MKRERMRGTDEYNSDTICIERSKLMFSPFSNGWRDFNNIQ